MLVLVFPLAKTAQEGNWKYFSPHCNAEQTSTVSGEFPWCSSNCELGLYTSFILAFSLIVSVSGFFSKGLKLADVTHLLLCPPSNPCEVDGRDLIQ